MRRLRLKFALLLLPVLLTCSTGGGDPVQDEPQPSAREGLLLPGSIPRFGGHARAVQSLVFDPALEYVELLPERSATTHWDLAYFWKYFPGMLEIDILHHDPVSRLLTLDITFTNPLESTLGDVRAIFPSAGALVPVTFDGWTVRDGAPIKNPNPYIAFGVSAPLRRLTFEEQDTREVVFSYEPPLAPKMISFVLDVVLEDNTAEPYEFGTPALTGRLFHVAISDWQDDITAVWLDVGPCRLPAPLRLAPFGEEGEWGTSVPDIPPGDYQLLLTAESPESPGEDLEGEPVPAMHWVDLHWPPDGPLVPLPEGQGIYGYSFIDPDTNLPPTDAAAVMGKFTGPMGGDWLILEYGEICNSGYLAMSAATPQYVEWMHYAAPDLPIHLNLDNLGFPDAENDPCQHPPLGYTKPFFDHLLASIRGQILENPDFDCISGIHLDIEPFPGQHSDAELLEIYALYADFLARLHLEPDLRGMNITVYDFDRHPHLSLGDLSYLCTTDAFLGACYFSRFHWLWKPSEHATPFLGLQKILGIFKSRAMEYGRPYYPILATFSGWQDGNEDTLGGLTPCGYGPGAMIDELCFGTGDFNTINEFDIVKAQDVHGMVVEEVILDLPSGEPVFPAGGFAVYRLGDGLATTVGDDIVYCRTAYSVSRALYEVMDSRNPLLVGTATFRFENDLSWKAAAFADPILRGDIAGVSGRIRFSDGYDLRHHPELWDSIQVELLDPLTQEIIENPVYRTSIDIVGIEDGSYVFPDLPRGFVTIWAVADGWESEPVTVDLRGFFAYEGNVYLLLAPS